MKYLYTILFLLLFCIGAIAETDVQINLTDPQFGLSQTTNRTVLVQAESGVSVNGQNVLLPFRLTFITDTNGICTASNLFGSAIAGWYHITVPAPPQRADFDIWVQSTNLGLISASSIIGTFGASTYPAQAFAWSAAVADNRYAMGTNQQGSFAQIGQLISTSNGIVSQFPYLTNGLAATNYSGFTTPAQATNIAGTVYSNNTAGYTTFSNLVQATNGLASLTSVANTNSANLVTTTNLVNAATNLMFNFTTNLVTVTSNGIVAQITAGSINATAATNIAFGVYSNNTLLYLTAATAWPAVSNNVWVVATNVANAAYSNNPAGYATLANVQATNSANLVTTTNLQVGSTNALGIGSGLSAFVPTNQWATYNFTTNLNTITSNGIVAQIVAVGGISIIQASNVSVFVYTNNGLNYVSNNQVNVTIDGNNIGTNTIGGKKTILGTSVQSGITTIASGLNSFVTGNASTASGFGSFASGISANATAPSAIAFSFGTASGPNSFAAQNGMASASGSFAAQNATASGMHSFAAGQNAMATNDYSVVFSDSTTQGSLTNNTFTGYFLNGYFFNGGQINGNGWGITNINSTNIVGAIATGNFVASTNGTANTLTVTGQLDFGGKTNVLLSTNVFGLTGAGDPAANGTYISTVVNTWTNTFNSAWQMVISAPNYFVQSNTVTHYASTDGHTWTTVPPGATPVPTGEFGSKWGFNGVQVNGVVYSTNITAQIAAQVLVATNQLTTNFVNFISTNSWLYSGNLTPLGSGGTTNIIGLINTGATERAPLVVDVFGINEIQIGQRGFNAGYQPSAPDIIFGSADYNAYNGGNAGWFPNVMNNGGNYGITILGGETNLTYSTLVNIPSPKQDGGGSGDDTILGGVGNIISNATACVVGGSYAYVKSYNIGSFVWSDSSSSTAFSTTTSNQFLVRAIGGFGINTNSAGSSALNVLGNINASSVSVNGTQLTNYPSIPLVGGTGISNTLNYPIINSGTIYAAMFYATNASLSGVTNNNGVYTGIGNFSGTNDFTMATLVGVVTNGQSGVTLSGTFSGDLTGGSNVTAHLLDATAVAQVNGTVSSQLATSGIVSIVISNGVNYIQSTNGTSFPVGVSTTSGQLNTSITPGLINLNNETLGGQNNSIGTQYVILDTSGMAVNPINQSAVSYFLKSTNYVNGGWTNIFCPSTGPTGGGHYNIVWSNSVYYLMNGTFAQAYAVTNSTLYGQWVYYPGGATTITNLTVRPVPYLNVPMVLNQINANVGALAPTNSGLTQGYIPFEYSNQMVFLPYVK